MSGLDVLLAVANIVYLISYSVRDILWLRIATVLGLTLLVPYYYLQDPPLWAPIGWNLVFLAINLSWIVKLLAERRPVQFSDEEAKLFASTFRPLAARDALKLFRMGTWSDAPDGTVLVAQGEAVEALTVIADGLVDVDIGGAVVDTLGKGRLVGVSALLMRGTNFRAPVTVAASGPIRILTWPTSTLVSAFANDEDLEVAIDTCLGVELTRFLQTSRTHTLHPHLA